MRNSGIEHRWWSSPRITSSSIGSISHHLCEFSIKVRSSFFVNLIFLGVSYEDDFLILILIVSVYVGLDLRFALFGLFDWFVDFLSTSIWSLFIRLSIVCGVGVVLRGEELVGSCSGLFECT